MTEIPTLAEVKEAAVRIAPYAHRTPVLTCRSLNEMTGATIFFKCENLQKVGAFKFRGACNTVFSLTDEEASRGVATHSSGNHAAALALAARLRGIRAHVVMPKNTKKVKKEAVESYGAQITYCEPTLEAREETLAGILEETGAVEIHPYNDPRIIAGQGTAAMELMEEIHDLDVILTPVGGGGLISGTALTVSGLGHAAEVIGVEPKGADDSCRSFYSGELIPSVNPRTIADGLLTSLGDLTFAIIRKHVADIVTVEEDEIISAIRTVWERMKIIIEPSSAVPVAAVLNYKVETVGKKVGIILTGGNVDLEKMPW